FDAQQWILIEVAFLDAAVLDAKLEIEHGGETVHRGALALVLRPAHIDDGTDIAGHGDLVHLHFLVAVHSPFSHFGEMPRMAEMESESEAAAGRQRFAPAGFFCGQLHNASGTASVERA